LNRVSNRFGVSADPEPLIERLTDEFNQMSFAASAFQADADIGW
jgi:hypothetical protein